MRLQSKFKDYYDYVGHVYRDTDPRAHVWERHTRRVEEEPQHVWNYANYTTHRLLLPGRVFEWEELSVLHPLYDQFKGKKSHEEGYPKRVIWDKTSEKYQMLNILYKDELALQMKYRTPLIYISILSGVVINPNLAKLGLACEFEAYGLYQQIEAWFGDGRFNEVPLDNRTDIQKVTSHGFDKKTSFRGKQTREAGK